jgi:hypothetical protein
VSCCGPAYEIQPETKVQLYFPYFETLINIEKSLAGKVDFNVNGARRIAPSKVAVFRQFLTDRLLLLKSGTINPFKLKLHYFTRNHYHFYKINHQHGSIDRS